MLCAILGVICCWIFYTQINVSHDENYTVSPEPQTSCEIRLGQLKAVLLEKKEENCQEETRLIQRELAELANIKQVRDGKTGIRKAE